MNLAYTVVAPEAGAYVVPFLEIRLQDGKVLRSKGSSVTVLPQPKASFSVQSSYTDARLYAPSNEAAFQKLVEENLFIRVEVNKKEVYIGEPVVASFTLYSRLQSSSQADRSPAFYGFSVMDMLDTREAHQSVKVVEGKVYNTSVLRKVQLYPVQSGKLTIDEMYVHNEVEFLDTVHQKKVKLEKEIITAPLQIEVRPLPQPPSFTGAVGNFTLHASLPIEKLERGGTGRLLVTLKGSGNFMQFTAPLITWPPAIESFEPRISGKTNRETAPLRGEKTYEFLFTAAGEGKQELPPVQFSFFDPAAASYRTLASDSFTLVVIPALSKAAPVRRSDNSTSLWWIALPAFFLAAIIIALTRLRRPAPVMQEAKGVKRDHRLELSELQREALTDAAFCSRMHEILLHFESEKEKPVTEIRAILQDCQQLVYAGAGSSLSRQSLTERAMRVVGE